jgi:hypothetical protein
MNLFHRHWKLFEGLRLQSRRRAKLIVSRVKKFKKAPRRRLIAGIGTE